VDFKAMPFDTPLPLIGVPACVKEIDHLPFHAAGDKYVRAVAEGAGGMPLVIPALGELVDIGGLVAGLDGLLVTGSLSNVAAHLYGGPADRPESPQDPARDATTLPLIRAALEAGLPMFCICRGLQELNVALGGTLHQQVHTRSGALDHRAPRVSDLDEKYGPVHGVELVPDGVFARILGTTRIEVNSLHWQAIERLAEGLVAEGRAPDGVVEAVSVRGAKGFAIGVQWHPEYKVMENPHSVKLFRAFGAAAREHAKRRGAPAAAGNAAAGRGRAA
jgi:putative glutamine amidotransferase